MRHEPRWMPLSAVVRLEQEAALRGVSEVARSPRGFLSAYKAAGTASKLDPYWRRRRANFVARHVAQAQAHGESWREPSGRRTRRALALIMWAFDPERDA